MRMKKITLSFTAEQHTLLSLTRIETARRSDISSYMSIRYCVNATFTNSANGRVCHARTKSQHKTHTNETAAVTFTQQHVARDAGLDHGPLDVDLVKSRMPQLDVHGGTLRALFRHMYRATIRERAHLSAAARRLMKAN